MADTANTSPSDSSGSVVQGGLWMLIPAILLAGVLWIILAAFELPVLGAVAGLGVLVIIAIQELPLLLGAWFGGSVRT